MPLELGDVPNWLQGIGSMFEAGKAVWADRQWRAGELARQLEAESQLSGPELADAITSDPRALGVFEFAFEAATRSASENKRWLLGKVLSTALTNLNRDDVIDRAPFFLRTVDALEPAHVRVLVLIATPDIDGEHTLAQSALEGATRREELLSRWPDAAELVDPLLRGLEREGLVVDRAVGTWGYTPAWVATPYGLGLLGFLPGGPLPSVKLDAAEVVVRYDKTGGGRLVVRNVGPARADAVSIAVPAGWQGQSLTEPGDPFELGLRDERAFSTVEGASPPFDVELTWRDGTGQRKRSRRVQPRE